jgi:CRP/FNR family transcriptional regulator, dissimilatory nitrate respiration regulator
LESELKQLAEYAVIKELKKNEHLFNDGDVAAYFYIVAQGTLKIFKIGINGEEQTLHIQKDFDLIAEAAIFDKQKFPAYCKAMENSKVIAIPKTGLVELIKQKPEFALKFLAGYSRRLREFVEQVEYLSMSDVKSRLAKYLIKHAQQNKSGKKYVELSITKKELATFIGTVPETLSRTFKKLSEEKIISIEASKINILDEKSLIEY